MKVKFFGIFGLEEVEFISLTPIIYNADLKWYLCYLKDKVLDYYCTKNLDNIQIIKDE